MKRFNKSYELSVFLMLFVLVIDGIKGDMSNRIDAEQDPFEDVTLADNSGARSSLFASCLASSRTLAVKFYSIEIPNTANEFIRYVPDSSQLTVTPEWITVARNPPVTKITDCAEAAHNGGNPMFKYSGGDDCKVCNQSYNLNYMPDCEAEEQNAVFISGSAVVTCSLPSTKMLISKSWDTYFCVLVSIGPLSFAERSTFCSTYSGTMYAGPFDSDRVEDLLAIIMERKGIVGNYTVAARLDETTGTWSWGGGSRPVDTALMVSAPSTSPNDMMFINGAAGFKLDFAPRDTYMGVVCVGAA